MKSSSYHIFQKGWGGIFSNNNCTWADPKILIRPKKEDCWVSVSGEEDGVVGVPAEGAVAAGVRSVVNVVRTSSCVGGSVGVAGND